MDIKGPGDMFPQNSHDDPFTAKAAGSSRKALTAVQRGTARCLLVLWSCGSGLTDQEICIAYRKAYPPTPGRLLKGDFHKYVSRMWSLCKPNTHHMNKNQENLNLIHRTDVTRINEETGQQMVVFDFIKPPTQAQLREWFWIARGNGSKKPFKIPEDPQVPTSAEKDMLAAMINMPKDSMSYRLLTLWEGRFIADLFKKIVWTPGERKKLYEIWSKVMGQ